MSDDQIQVRGGCNSQAANYYADSQSFSVSMWVSTRMYCSDDHDSDITRAFSRVTRAEQDQQTVHFFDEEGNKVMSLRQK